MSIIANDDNPVWQTSPFGNSGRQSVNRMRVYCVAYYTLSRFQSIALVCLCKLCMHFVLFLRIWCSHVRLIRYCVNKPMLKRCSHCARHRTMSYDVVRCSCNWTHWFNGAVHSGPRCRTTSQRRWRRNWTWFINFCVNYYCTARQFLKVVGRHRTTSSFRCRCVVHCRTTSCINASSAVVRCCAQCEHRLILAPLAAM